MLVQEEKEIPICKLVKKGQVKMVPLSEENAEILSKEDIFDFYQIVSECVNNSTASWYFPITVQHRLRPIRILIVSPGKTLEDEIIESYRERYDEDLEMAEELFFLEGDIIEPEDK